MNLFKDCLLACDIDGTLEYNGEISEHSIEKIHYFVGEGGKFCLSTGRGASAVGGVLSKLRGYISPSVVGNGTVIYDFDNNQSLNQIFLSSSAFDIIRIVYNKFPTVAIELHSEYNVYSLRSNQESIDHANHEGMTVAPIGLESLENIKLNKVLFADDNRELFEDIKLQCSDALLNDATLKNTAADLGGKKRHYLELIPNGVSKASALKVLCDILKIKNGGCFAIGDYYNDLEMIESSDIGCFTADAPQDLQLKADFVAGFAKDGAVADFIDYLTEKFSTR